MSGSGSRTPFSPTPASSATRTGSTPSPTSARRRSSRAAAGPRVHRLTGAPGGTSTSVIAATSSPGSAASPPDTVGLAGRHAKAEPDLAAAALDGGTVLDGGGELGGHTPAVTRLREELAVGDGHLAAQDDRCRPAVHLPAVPGAVIGAVQVR